jgi:hypothetical protein
LTPGRSAKPFFEGSKRLQLKLPVAPEDEWNRGFFAN